MDAPIDVTGESSGGNNSRAISEAFKSPETVNLTEKIESSHQRHNRQHNDGEFTSLGFLLGMPVKLSNGIKQQSNLHTQGETEFPNWLLGALHGEQNLTALNKCAVC